MPEGDSVYRLARKLDTTFKGQRITRSDLRVAAHATADLTGATLLEHDTHGKHLLTRFDSGITLRTHLKMQGSWTVTRPGRSVPRTVLPDVRVILGTAAGHTAFGILLPVVDLVETAREHELVGHLGPDPLRRDWDATTAVARLAREPDRAIAAALLDQRNLAGLGNLWVNELCFLRGISPWTAVRDVDLPAMVALAARALRHSAHNPRAYQVTTGNARPGEDHWVSGRAGMPCRRCGTPVEVVAEIPGDPERRRTWWCPHCQPGPGPESDRVRRK